jgi:signal transduction histidine kinase
MIRRSLQHRLFAVLLLSQLLLTTLLTLAAIAYSRQSLISAFDAELAGRALALAALVHYPEDGRRLLIFDEDRLSMFLRSAADVCDIRTAHGVIYRSPGWQDLPVAGGETHWRQTLKHNGSDYRVVHLKDAPLLDEPDYIGPRMADTLIVTYGSPLYPVTRHILILTASMIAAGILCCGITVVLGIRALKRSLHPLQELAAAATGVSVRKWEFQVPPSVEETAELKPLANSLALTIEGLRSSFRQQEEFIANAAHEFKTPIAILKSCLQRLERQSHSIDEYRTGVAESLEDVARIESLLSGMLSLARLQQSSLESGQQPFELIDLCDTCASAAARIQSLAQSRRIGLELRLDGHLPVRAAPEDLEMAWTKLIENSIYYSSAGSTVTLTAHRSGAETAELTVEDAGIGIPAGDLPHIFERFYRVDRSRTRNTGGTGLGLAITKAVVEACGGQISVTSELGRGTCFCVRMPLQGGADYGEPYTEMDGTAGSSTKLHVE